MGKSIELEKETVMTSGSGERKERLGPAEGGWLVDWSLVARLQRGRERKGSRSAPLVGVGRLSLIHI